MTQLDDHFIEESLDPEDWNTVRKLGHQMVDDMIEYLKTVRDRPVWQPIPETVKNKLNESLPLDPQGPDKAYQDFRDFILPHPMGNIHPRFWGWVIGTGTVTGMFAEMLAAAMNPNLGGGEHVANYVETQVIEWLKKIFDYPDDASGLLVSGGSMANLLGLTVARNTKAGFDIRQSGIQNETGKMVLYGSTEMHSSLQKAVELLGLGNASLRQIPVDSEFRIDTQSLLSSILKDRIAGNSPFCVIGNSGTVNTGAIDDLNALADICQKENLWFHVDGAFGSLAALSPTLKHLVAGLEKADSIALDLHKWMFMPIEIGCVLIKNQKEHRSAFTLIPDYLAHGGDRGLAAGSHWPSDYGIQLTRGFRALKAWMSIKEHGIDKYGRMIRQNVDQARYLADLIDNEHELERLAPVPLNIVCFRFFRTGRNKEFLNRLNQEIMIRLHENGIAVPTYTLIKDVYALRVAITNHRSRRDDFKMLVDEVLRLGRQLSQEWSNNHVSNESSG